MQQLSLAFCNASEHGVEALSIPCFYGAHRSVLRDAGDEGEELELHTHICITYIHIYVNARLSTVRGVSRDKTSLVITPVDLSRDVSHIGEKTSRRLHRAVIIGVVATHIYARILRWHEAN